MNNREYANGLSDTEFVKWGRKFFGTDWDSASVIMSDDEIAETSVEILNQEHETTGHEDLVSAGWELWEDYIYPIKYNKQFNGTRFLLEIYEHENKYKVADMNGYFYDDGINFLRKCADKIRKERGWA